MFDTLKKWLTGGRSAAAGEGSSDSRLTPPPITKQKTDGVTVPSSFSSPKPQVVTMPQTDRRLLNTDLTTLRTGTESFRQVRDFVASSPELGSAVFNYIRLGVTSRYRVVFRNLDGTINVDGTKLVQQIIARMDRVGLLGRINGESGVAQVSEQLAKEIIQYGACASELVLGKGFVPERIQPFSVTQVKYKPLPNGKGVQPFQILGEAEISLLYPTVVIINVDQDLLQAYSESMVQSALQPALFGVSFSNQLTRVVERAIHPRTKVEVDEEKVRKWLSPEAQMDRDKAAEEVEELISQISDRLNSLQPEDALVYLNTMKVTVDNSATSGLASEYDTLQKYIDSRLIAGARSMPAVMGKGGNQNTASAEVMLFVKAVESVVKSKLDAVWSRHMTTAVRLLGIEGYADFSFDPVSLRPEEEMQAFKQTRLSIMKDLLSMGFITDEEFSIEMTGELPPAGHVPLSGTMFAVGGRDLSEKPQEKSNSGSTLNQNLNDTPPKQGRGGNQKVDSYFSGVLQ